MSVVLLIEDDYAIATLYKTKLESSDYYVEVSSNGLEGLKQVELLKPDIILLDLKMPYMTGEEFLIKLRKNIEYRDIPVIVLTNVSREEAPKTLWHYGIAGYFVKAHNTPAELVNIIVKTL